MAELGAKSATTERAQPGFHELADQGGGVCETQAHEWAKLESPCWDLGVCTSLKGWGRRVARSQRRSGTLTSEILTVILLTAVQPRRRGRGIETPEQAAAGFNASPEVYPQLDGL